MAPLRLLSSGIDSLYLSVHGALIDGLMVWLHAMREMCGSEDTAFDFAAEEGSFLLRTHGWRGYPYWMSSPRFELMVGNRAPFPAVYVQLHSAFLHTLGAETAVIEVEHTLRHLFAKGWRLVPSRLDVYADVQGWQPRAEDFERFVCRGVRRRMFTVPVPQEMHGMHTRLSGFTFGKHSIVARIYDKSLELSTRGEDWPAVFWGERISEEAVWRIEFQFRRAALVELGIADVSVALSRRQDVWRYGTQWLSLRHPALDVNRSRWPEDAMWSALREVRIGMPHSDLVRERVRAADQRRLLSGFIGYTSSLAAVNGQRDMEAAVRRVIPLATRYLNERGVQFAEVVGRKQSLRRATR